MGEFTIGFWSKLFSWVSSLVIISLNLNYLINSATEGLKNPSLKFWLIFFIIPFLLISFLVLLYIIIRPIFRQGGQQRELNHHSMSGNLSLNLPNSPKKILITVDFSSSDEKAISKALFLGGKKSEYVLLHVVETAGAFFSGSEAMDHETESDRKQLDQYVSQLIESGYKVSGSLGFGNPKKSIPVMVKDSGADLLIMGGHGHHRFKDLIFGTTVERVRHQITIPVVIV